MDATRPATCPCCLQDNTRCLGALPDSAWFAGTLLASPIPGGLLHRCGTCHLAFRYPVQDPGAYEGLYDTPVPPAWSGTARRRDWDLLAAHAARHSPRASTILDFGCNTGGLLARFGSIPHRYGIEINASAAQVATQATGATVFPRLDAVPRGLRFDLITACDVIEHVPNPRELILSLLDRLTDDGRLMITTGDADAEAWIRSGPNWWYCYYPEHIAFISGRWLAHFQDQGDFTVRACINFRQGELGAPRRRWNQLLMNVYGRHPGLLLAAARFARKLLGKGPPASVPGNGVTADHLLIILEKGGNRR